MDINILKSELGRLKAPDNLSNFQIKDENQSSGFIDRLKNADKKSKEILRRFYIIYFVISLFYLGLFILNPDQDLKLNDRINGTLLFLGILLFAIYGKVKYSELRKLRYDQPTQIFLLKTLGRYKFWPREMNYVLLFVLLVDVGSCRSFVHNYPVFYDLVLDVIAFQVVFILAMSVGLYFGYVYWKNHKKPIVDEIGKLLREEE